MLSALFALVFAVVLEPAKTEIVIPQDASKVVRFAAEEMKLLLSPVLGGEVPVVATPTAGKRGVYLGESAWAQAAGVTSEGLARDGYRIGANEKGVFIVGKDDPRVDPERNFKGHIWAQHYERGTVNGVYGFLEEFAGVRLYFPGELGTVTPRRELLELKDGVIKREPYWTLRRYTTIEGLWYEGEDRRVDATMRERWINYFRLRMETVHVPFNHGESHLQCLRRFGETHPEYFGLRPDGKRRTNPKGDWDELEQFCHTSGIWEEIYQDCKAYLSGLPCESRGLKGGGCGDRGWPLGHHGKYVDIMPQDCMKRCCCENCRKVYDNDEKYWGDTIIWSKTAEIARRLTAEGLDARVTQMAYGSYGGVPNVDLPENVDVMVAEHGPWSIIDPIRLKGGNERIKAWAGKTGHGVCEWSYPLKFKETSIPDVPCYTPRAWGRYYGDLAPYLLGEFAESNGEHVMFRLLSLYVLGHIGWDKNFDWEKAINEFYRLMFGPAEKEMRAFGDSLEDMWLHGVLLATDMNGGGPSAKVVGEEVLRTKVYTPELCEEYAKLFAAARRKTKTGSIERRRVDMMEEELLKPLLKAVAFWRGRAEGVMPTYRLNTKDKMVLSPLTLDNKAVGPNAPLSYAQARIVNSNLEVAVFCEEPEMNHRKAKLLAKNDRSHYYGDGLELMINTPYYGLIHVAVSSEGSFLALRNWKEWDDGIIVKVDKKESSWTACISIPMVNLGKIGNSFKADITRYRRLNISYYTEPERYRWSRFAYKAHEYERFGTWLLPEKAE